MKPCLMTVAILLGGAVGAVQADEPYPRYGWATNDDCWSKTLEYRKLVFAQGRPDPQVHERKMHEGYDRCMAQRGDQRREPPATVATPRGTLRVADLEAAVNAGNGGAVGLALHRPCRVVNGQVDAAAWVTLDNGTMMGCQKLAACLLLPVQYLVARRACEDRPDADARKARDCLERLLSERRPNAEGQLHDPGCPFALVAVSDTIASDVTRLQQLDQRLRQQEQEQAAREEEQAQRRRDAEQRALQSPEYQQAVAAADACNSYAAQRQIGAAIQRQRTVDSLSGTTDPFERRRLSEVGFEVLERGKAAMTKFEATGGKYPKRLRHPRKGEWEHWCRAPLSLVIPRLVRPALWSR